MIYQSSLAPGSPAESTGRRDLVVTDSAGCDFSKPFPDATTGPEIVGGARSHSYTSFATQEGPRVTDHRAYVR